MFNTLSVLTQGIYWAPTGCQAQGKDGGRQCPAVLRANTEFEGAPILVIS